MYIIRRFHIVSASYLQTPRINFKGRFRADISTINNLNPNYLLSAINQNTHIDDGWNPRGTGTWELIDCVVTSAVYTNDEGETTEVTSPQEDSVVGLPLINNPETAFAKLVDVDPDQQLSSTIYGMSFGVNWDPITSKNDKRDQKDAFIGDFQPAVITRDLWTRQIVNSDENLQQPAASHGVSRLENIIWSKKIKSEVLKKFKKDKKPLSIMFSIYNYTRPPTEDLFTHGNLVGSIGIAEDGESLSFPENRVMFPSTDQKKVIEKFPLADDKPCNRTSDWMSTTYFDIQDSKMTVDFSNSFKIDIQGNICHFYPFYVGISYSNPQLAKADSEGTITEVEIVDIIPYMEEGWYNRTAGVVEFTLSELEKRKIVDAKVVVVTLYDYSTESHEVSTPQQQTYPICDPNPSSESSNTENICAYVILEESPCLVSPMDYYVHRMEKDDDFSIDFKARYYGQPQENMKIKLIDVSQSKAGSYMDYSPTMETDSNGIATFHFVAGDVGEPRDDMKLDGQIFKFGYCLEHCMDDCNQCSELTNAGNLLIFLVWSPVNYKEPYFWDRDVMPIFQQYENLYPVMRNILKLGDYDDVTKPGNIRLLNLSMHLDIKHPSYMPVTRDLSPTKRDMILKWLNTPNHPRNWEDVEQKLFEPPHFCSHMVFAFDEKKTKRDQVRKMQLSGMSINKDSSSEEQEDDEDTATTDERPSLADSDIAHHFRTIASPHPDSQPSKTEKSCTVDGLKQDLQTAINLEFSTIPPYLTALYSIKDGYNRFVYDTIRSVVMQEMLHLAQAANLLISIGGRPLIDDPSVAISYPSHLPGNVLPGLIVTLRKATPKHIADVFMMIEFPDEVIAESAFHEAPIDMNALTIGEFYDSIKKCMKKLDKENEITFGYTDTQLHWPWTMYDKSSNLYKVDSIKTAKQAIKMIVEQGEGTKQMDPTYLKTDKLAHFFKFEELACKRHLQVFHEHSYNFEGEEIQFVPEGVWPMRDDPKSNTIPKGSQMYYEAKTFHRIYRSLLKSLQTAFDGQPDAINDAVYIMESMQIQAKRLMQMEMPTIPLDHPRITCGPVFEYEWEDEN